MSLRLQRVRELLKREIGEIIRREIPVGEAGLITVNDVEVSSDLHAATVYIGILGSCGAAEDRTLATQSPPQTHPGTGRQGGHSQIHTSFAFQDR